VLSFDEVARERLKGFGGFAERLEGGEGVGNEFLGVFAGLVDSEDCRPGCLDAGCVLTGSFA